MRLTPPTKAVSVGWPASISQLFWCWQKASDARSHRMEDAIHVQQARRDRPVFLGRCDRSRCSRDLATRTGRGRGSLERRPDPAVEERASTVRETEVGSEEGGGQPDAVPCGFDGFANALERRGAINERPDKVAGSNGVQLVTAEECASSPCVDRTSSDWLIVGPLSLRDQRALKSTFIRFVW